MVFCFPNAAHTISKSTNRANARIKIGHAKTDDSEQCSTVEQPSSRMALTIDGVGLFQKLIGRSFGSLPSSPLAEEEETSRAKQPPAQLQFTLRPQSGHRKELVITERRRVRSRLRRVLQDLS